MTKRVDQSDIEVLQSQIRQQRENVRVWEEGLEREKRSLQLMKSALTEAMRVLEEQENEVLADDGEN